MIRAKSRISVLRTALTLSCAVFGSTAAYAQSTLPPAPPPAEEEAVDDAGDIVVTGFRQSLEAALDVKRDSISAVDAIVAEDMADFPDQNLAESLQRIPGISIQRDGGEGRAITVRGLGAQFTRVRLNGLETVATSTDGASANRDRAFDFNVFASELFNSIVVRKTAEASLDEGSLGAVVDLNTGNPLAARSGLTGAFSAQASYNDLAESWGPRFAGLLNWANDADTFGVSVSGAYSRGDTLQLGNNTVRWAQARFDSVDGTRCFTTQNSGGTYVPSAACDRASLSFHPRIPRYGEIAHDRERLGLTGTVQWHPSDRTELEINALYSRFSETRDERWGEVLFRSNERAIDVINPVYDANNNMIAGRFNDAWVRTENYSRQSETEFYQIGATLKQEFSDSFRIELLGGFSQSDANIPVETTIVFDDRDAQNYQYDYSNMARPVLTFGTSVEDPANFQLAEIRDRPSGVTNEFETVQLRSTWDVGDDVSVQAGGVYRQFQFETAAFTRDTVVCGNGGVDRVLGTLTCSPSSLFGPTAVVGFPVTPALSELFQLGNAGQPAGTTTRWIVPNLPAATEFTRLYSRVPAVDAGNTRAVEERVFGGFFQFDARGELFGLEYALNAGLRYAETRQRSTGLNNGAAVTVERTYSDWLPAANLALFPADGLILRLAAADVMTRPTLGNLTPGGSVDGFNYRVTFGNPFLEPFRATAYDLALEWYFAENSIFSVALFRKDVSSFPVAVTRSGTFASTGLPVSVIPPSSPAAINPEGQIWTINSIGNGAGATLEGAEIALQVPLTFLPGFLSNFGIIANATFVDSDADYTVSGPAIVPGGPLVARTETATLFGLSKRAFNGTLYYEDGGFSARASVSYRSRFIDANSGTGNVFEGYGSSLNVDASVRYAITDNIEVSVEGINLTDDYRYRFTDFAADRNYENNHFGRTFLFGVRYRL